MLHGLVHEVDVEKCCRIGDRRMAAVEDADLHQLVRRDIGHELYAHLFQRWTSGGEMILHHPLLEFFAEDWPVVVNAEFIRQQIDFTFAGRRRNAVHHRIRERDIGMDPVGEFRIRKPGQSAHRVFCHMAVSGNVVAGHDGKGRGALGLAHLQSAMIRPNTVFGSSGACASATIAGCAGLKWPSASMK